VNIRGRTVSQLLAEQHRLIGEIPSGSPISGVRSGYAKRGLREFQACGNMQPLSAERANEHG